MPAQFLSEEQRKQYGKYTGELTLAQLERYFLVDKADLDLIDVRRGDHNRLGFALQLGTVRFLGTFLSNPIDVPHNVASFVAQQLQISDWENLSGYLERPRTYQSHAGIIQRHYGYRNFNDQPEHWRFVRWLYSRAWVGAEGPTMLFDMATAQLSNQKILLPGVTTLERLVGQVRERVSRRVWRLLSRLPDEEQCCCLESLLDVDSLTRQTLFDRLRRSPTRVSAPSLVHALRRLRQVRALKIRHFDPSRIPPSRFKSLSRQAFTARAQTIERMPRERRIATLLAFVHELETIAQDDALEVLALLVKGLLAKSETEGKKERLRTLQDLDSAALKLSTACNVLLDASCRDTQIRKIVFEQIPQEELATAVVRVEDLARLPDDQYYPEVLSRWRSVRRFLPLLLDTIEFEATKAARPLLAAVQFLRSIEGKRQSMMADAPLIPMGGWSHWIVLADGRIDRKAYTFCVLEQLIDSLRRRELYVSPSVRWSNPQAKLLQGQAWESERARVCRTLNLAAHPARELERLGQQLGDAYQRTANNLASNSAVSVEREKGRDTLTVGNLDKLEEPESLLILREEVERLLPRVDLPEAILEIHARTGFLDGFTHAHEEGIRTKDRSVSLCAVLIGMACNIGLSAVQHKEIPALNRHRLAWMQQHYIRPETLSAANACLVEAQSRIPLARVWGGGEVASADGLRFVVPVRTLNAGPNSKYFGRGRGITYYNFVSDQFTGFHGLVVTGTLRDSLVVLVGLLEQKTSLEPRELMTDTAGYSDLIFGLFWLLGYQFSPRLADVGAARFWRLDPQADYGVLDGLARQRVKTALIEEHWDDMLRCAGSLKLGHISAAEIVPVLQRGGRPSALGKAIRELGRVAKTIYLLNYVDDEAYRRRILTQLNRGEGRHSLARAVCYGRKGEIRQRYREGQEDQLNALGLVVNALVLWNTFYMNRALDYLRQQGLEVMPADAARLSPLGDGHIQVLGRYHFELDEKLKHGGVRPLHEFNDYFV